VPSESPTTSGRGHPAHAASALTALRDRLRRYHPQHHARRGTIPLLICGLAASVPVLGALGFLIRTVRPPLNALVTGITGELAPHIGLTTTITRPIHAYLVAHASGIPLGADHAYTLWWSTGVVTFTLATCYSLSGRIGWTAWGAVTLAMVAGGTPAGSRAVAVTFTAAVLGVATRCALRRPVQRRGLTFTMHLVHHPAPPAASTPNPGDRPAPGQPDPSADPASDPAPTDPDVTDHHPGVVRLSDRRTEQR
jgi:hypothetical protein